MARSTALVQSFLRSHPSIDECFRAGLLNLAALARFIAEENRDASPSALLMALSRLSQRTKTKALKDKRYIKLVRAARIITRTGLMLAILSTHKYDPRLVQLLSAMKKRRRESHLIEGLEYITLVTSQEFKDEIKNLFKSEIEFLYPNVAQVSIVLDASTQMLPGITAFILRLVAEQNINVLEVGTTYGEDMLLVDEKDLIATMEALRV